MIISLHSCSDDLIDEIKSSEKSLTTLELETNGATYPIIINESSLELESLLPYGTVTVTIKEIKTSPKATVNKQVGDIINTSESPILFKVTAEDGSSQNYNLNLAFEKSNEKNLITIKLEDNDITYSSIINESSVELESHLPYGTETVTIQAIEISSKATVNKKVGDIINTSENPILFKVTAEDGTSQNYTLNLTFDFEKKGVIDILIIDADEHGKGIADVITNKLIPASLSDYDQQHESETLFDLHEDIAYDITESYDDFNPNKILADIVNQSSSVYHNSTANDNLEQFLDKRKFPKFPLVVSSAGNTVNTCTQFAYDFALENGGLAWYDHIASFYGCNPSGNGSDCDEKATQLYKACDLGIALVIQETSYAENFIIVGQGGPGQKPGPILKSRWITTYYQFTYNDGNPNIQGSSFSTPYVVKIAAEIKRRAPHYSNDDIAQLIFTTAHDEGEPGIDEVYGNGILNPKGIFDELTRRGF